MALRCEGILCEAMAFSNFGVYCIRWLRSFSSSLSALRHAVCSAIFKEDFKIAEIVGRDEDYLKSASSWLDFLILSDSLLWKCKSFCFHIWTFEINFLSCVRIFMVLYEARIAMLLHLPPLQYFCFFLQLREMKSMTSIYLWYSRNPNGKNNLL